MYKRILKKSCMSGASAGGLGTMAGNLRSIIGRIDRDAREEGSGC